MRGTEVNREGYGITMFEQKLYVIGGDENNKLSAKTECFNFRTNQWELKCPLKVPRR